MLYSSAGFLAVIIHLIINHDVLWQRTEKNILPVDRSYRGFLFAVLLYYISDILWGLLYERGLIALTFADTSVYFTAMAVSILLWTRYVIQYLKEDTGFGRLLGIIGSLFFGFEMIVLVLNFFRPVLFYFDENHIYHAGTARYITLAIQILLFTMTAIYAFIVACKSAGTMKLRHRTIGLFSLSMAGFITAQACFPLLPLYAIGCMLGCCVLHSFVLENEKEEYREQLEERLQDNILKGNYYDLLTGLPGMSYFFELAQAKISKSVRGGGQYALLHLNLSGLKFYNQSHGFSEGDKLLRSLAQLLIGAFGIENCSRLGQDHFAVLSEAEGLEEVLNRIFADWESAHGQDCPAILVGVYIESSPDIDVNTACDLAKIACDAIQGTYTSSIQFFDDAMYVNAQNQQYIIAHLDQAIREKWIQVYYQPIVRTSNGKVCDEEALARWIDPTKGFLSPAEFIPILEEARLIYKLDLYIVDQVLEKMRHLSNAGLYLVPQSINLSRSDFDSCDIVEEILKRVDACGFPHNLLTIEITESLVGSDFEFIKRQAERFRKLGFSIWMDDFGSGYSSLDVLQSMPVDLIKFDMRFMQQFDHEDKSRVILSELMKMAVGLGIDTLCEGVERLDQVRFLQEIGCSKLQGYYFAKPMPEKQILERYKNGTQISFENPDESDYFDAIGRINLYDLAVIANEEEDRFQHYFSTVPMAIIEVRGNKARFTRSNQAYRDFIERTFHISLAQLHGSFEETPEGPGLPFVVMLRQCCKEGGRAIFDEAMPDGTIVHSFMRRIAENPLTGTIAAAVAVLAISDPREVSWKQ